MNPQEIHVGQVWKTKEGSKWRVESIDSVKGEMSLLSMDGAHKLHHGICIGMLNLWTLVDKSGCDK